MSVSNYPVPLAFHFLTVADQDEYVREAIIKALIAEGAAKVSFIYEYKLTDREPKIFRVEDGWKEADTMENES